MKLNRKNKKGFTIVELVIVIAVIGILAAILIPTFTNLTKNAQESAKKQTVGDGYTVYLAEAVDGKYDDLYKLVDTKYVDANIAISNKKQGEVVAKYKDEYFLYNQEKGWENQGTALPTGISLGDLVCNHYVDGEDPVALDSKLYSGEAGHAVRFDFSATGYTKAKANEALSTFNTVVFYVAEPISA